MEKARTTSRASAGARLARAGAAADGGDAVELHQLEQLLPTLLAQNLAHERTERMHVLAQRLVLGRKVDVAAVHLQYLSGPLRRWAHLSHPASSTASARSSSSG